MTDATREALRKLVYRIRQRSTNKLHNREFAMTLDDCVRELTTLQQPEAGEPVLVWRDGAPSKPWSEEWFIAETTFRDRVVLKALPEEWTYDFKTADDTYIKADKIKRWMQFPDSQYIAPPASADMREALEHIRAFIDGKVSTSPDEICAVIDKALANAQGTTSEGGVFAHGAPEDIASIPANASEPMNIRTAAEIEADRKGRPSDPTPPDREAVARPAAFLAWAVEMFGPVAKLQSERLMRFVEEAVELAHADNMERATLDAIINRVYSRPPGYVPKEIGQAQATLETYAENIGVSSDDLAEREWQRVQNIPREEWEGRHAAKQALGIALTSGRR